MIDYDFQKAVNENNNEQISKYLDEYDFFNTKNDKNETILHYCSKEGMKNVLSEILIYLKKNKSNYLDIINQVDNRSWNCLFSAIDSTENGLPEIVEILIRNGLKVNYQDMKGLTALHLACYKGQDDNVEYLIKNNADINAKDVLGRSPLSFAIMEGQTNAIQALLDAGADLDIYDNEGKSLLHYCVNCKGNALLYILMLTEKGVNINVLDKEKSNILLHATRSGIKNNLRLINKIIEIGGDKNMKNINGENFYTEVKKQCLNDEGFLSEMSISNKNTKHKSKKIPNLEIIFLSLLVILLAKLFDKI